MRKIGGSGLCSLERSRFYTRQRKTSRIACISTAGFGKALPFVGIDDGDETQVGSILSDDVALGEERIGLNGAFQISGRYFFSGTRDDDFFSTMRMR